MYSKVISRTRNPDNDCALGKVIISLLESLNKNQLWLSEQIGITPCGINGIIKGRFKPAKRTILYMAIILETNTDDLINAFTKDWGKH